MGASASRMCLCGSGGGVTGIPASIHACRACEKAKIRVCVRCVCEREREMQRGRKMHVVRGCGSRICLCGSGGGITEASERPPRAKPRLADDSETLGPNGPCVYVECVCC